MPLFRRSVRLAVEGPGPGIAYFAWKNGEPVVSGWDAQGGAHWRLIRRVDCACKGVEGVRFLHLDLRTPYGEALGEEQVTEGLHEALGPRFEDYLLRGWHVAHLEDTHLGSNHRVFATLERGTGEEVAGSWDQAIPLEMAVEALGEWLARVSGKTVFQLVLEQGPWIYSLAYRNAQPFHLLRLPAEPQPYALRRLAGHRVYLRQAARDSGEIPVFLHGEGLREECVQALGQVPEAFPAIPNLAKISGPGLWHFGLALAAMREEVAAHNPIPESRLDRNLQVRLVDRLAKFCLLAAFLGMAVALGEGLRNFKIGRDLEKAKTQAGLYAEKVVAVQDLRREKRELTDALLPLRSLWAGPAPVDRMLRGIAAALPSNAGLDGFLLREGMGSKAEIAFRGWVGDWNQVAAVKKSLAALPFFSAVELSDQRKDLERGRVYFQASCTLRKP